MADFAALIRWIITYAVSGGFWHFMATWIIVGALIKALWLVRVDVKLTRKTKKAPA